MKFGNMVLNQFKLFAQPQTFPLMDQGLVLVRGDNRVSKVADNNGVGKTSIIDGVVWILKGLTTRMEEAAEVACRFTDERCHGSLELLLTNDEWWTVTRMARPSAMTLLPGRLDAVGDEIFKPTGESIKEVQVRLDDMVPYGRSTIINGMIFGQETFDRFARASIADQMLMVDELQGMDWRKYLATSKVFRTKQQERAAEAQTAWATATENANAAQQQVRSLTEAKQQFEMAKAQRVLEAEQRVATAQQQLETLQAAQVRHTLMAKRIVGVRKQWATVVDADRMVAASKMLWDAASERRGKEEGNLTRLRGEVESLLKAKRCAKCRTQFQVQDAMARLRASFQADIDAAATEVSRLKAVEADRKREMDQAQAVAVKARTFLPAGFDAAALASMETELRLAEVDPEQLTVVAAAVTEVKAAVARERASIWDGAVSLTAIKGRLETHRVQERDNKMRLEQSTRWEQMSAYWVEAFGDRGIRNLMFASIQDFMNSRWAYHLGILCGGEVIARMSPQSATKSGKLRDKLGMEVEWTWGAKTYKSGSGGQDRRVDLALFASVQDVSESMSANPFPAKFWDQPDDNLDARGAEMFCQWVEQEARSRGTGILITHNPELLGMAEADNIWTIVLDRNGSRLEIA